MMDVKSVDLEIGGRRLSLETGKIGRLANGTVLVRYVDTVVLVSVVWKKSEEKRDFMPLLVEYREGAYSAGKIPGGFIKREGRPSDREILISRAIDRSLRPMFPKGMMDDVEVVALMLSYDNENEPLVPAIIGASAALSISEIPFEGPIGAVIVGKVGEQLIINPTNNQLEQSEFELLLVGTEDGKIHMIEFEGKQIPEDTVLEAIEFATPYIKQTIEFQKKLVELAGKPKEEPTLLVVEDEILQEVEKYAEEIRKALFIREKNERNKALDELKERVIQELSEKFPEKEVEIGEALYRLQARIMREEILKHGIRPDGRGLEDLRPISIEVGLLPRTHGSALFTRGETQALVIATLGTSRDVQILTEIEEGEEKRFMLHYNFHPFSTGDIKPLRGPSRREIGHGALAEKSLRPVIPDEDEFPYTIRIVSEITESNGSTSMATVTGGSLALMDAGVPIKAPVAGISIGLVLEDYDKYALLTDIQGMEDHLGDMDFKVAGTENGITGIQLDLKIRGLTLDIVKKAFERAKKARLDILEKMKEVIPEPRSNISRYAPKIAQMTVPLEKIADIIGPSGKVIKKIIHETDTTIDIDDTTGKVLIYGKDQEGVNKAREMIEEITAEVEVGKIYTGTVVRVEAYGVFVEILPGKVGLVHVSELDTKPVRDARQLYKVGDKIVVKVIDLDEMGRPKLSRKQALRGRIKPPGD